MAKTNYSAYIVSGGTKYDVTPVLVGHDRAEDEDQIAQIVNLQLMNIKVGGSLLSDLLKPRSRVYLYANDGSTDVEVFRGYLWTRPNGDETDLQYKCYDNLIYFQESEDSLYFSSGKKTKDVFSSICDKWGIKMSYSYESITHSKLLLRGKLADIFKADILDLVKDRTGKKYVVLSDKDTMHVKPVGSNTTIYHFTSAGNVTKASTGWTMDGMITKVVIVGKTESSGREPVEATVKGNTDEYGTLQKIIDRKENTSLSDAKLEAKEIIDKNGKPFWEYQIKAADIPWIRKGDKVYVDAGDISKKYLIVASIERSISNKKQEMSLTLIEE